MALNLCMRLFVLFTPLPFPSPTGPGLNTRSPSIGGLPVLAKYSGFSAAGLGVYLLFPLVREVVRMSPPRERPPLPGERGPSWAGEPGSGEGSALSFTVFCKEMGRVSFDADRSSMRGQRRSTHSSSNRHRSGRVPQSPHKAPLRDPATQKFSLLSVIACRLWTHAHRSPKPPVKPVSSDPSPFVLSSSPPHPDHPMDPSRSSSPGSPPPSGSTIQSNPHYWAGWKNILPAVTRRSLESLWTSSDRVVMDERSWGSLRR